MLPLALLKCYDHNPACEDQEDKAFKHEEPLTALGLLAKRHPSQQEGKGEPAENHE